jgi:hypothetical protein
MMVKVALADVTPPSTTVMVAFPAVMMKLAGTVAINCVELTKVVGNCEPFICTVAPGANPVPLTVKAKDGCPADTLGGLSELIVGGAVEPFTVKLTLLEPRPFATTIMGNVPGAAIRFAGTNAVNWVGLTNVVCNGTPFQYANVADVNPVPLTVRVKAAPPTLALAGLSELIVG